MPRRSRFESNARRRYFAAAIPEQKAAHSSTAKHSSSSSTYDPANSPRSRQSSHSPVAVMPFGPRSDQERFVQPSRMLSQSGDETSDPILPRNERSSTFRAGSYFDYTINTRKEDSLRINSSDHDDAESIHGLREARALYGDIEVPDFVMGKPQKQSLRRKVDIATRENDFYEGELTFEFWDQDHKKGFWTLVDGDGVRRIVKYFSTGANHGYRPWLGVHKGYADRAMAVIKGRGKSSETETISSHDSAPDKHRTVVGISDDDGKRRSLRKRKVDQVRPYSAEKANYRKSMGGEPKHGFKTKHTPDPGLNLIHASTKAKSNSRKHRWTPAKSKSRRTPAPTRTPPRSGPSCGSSHIAVTPSSAVELVPLETIQKNTTLYVSSDTVAPAPVYLKSCKDIDSFFSLMSRVAEVEEEEVGQITVQFRWLPESKPNTIRMIRGLDDTYDKMIEEIRNAPTGENPDVFVKVTRRGS